MSKQYESLADLKRSVYLWVIPCILIALILNTIMQNVDGSDKLSFVINNTMTIWFAVSWVLVYKKQFVRFSELSNLALVSIYHVTTFFDTIFNYLLKVGGSLGDFIVWMPIIIMFIFLTLGIKKGLYYSIGIYLITLIGGIVVINKLSAESIDSLMQFYFANLVYIIVLFYAQHMFRAYAKMELLKKYAYLDSLTGVANRHQIDEWLDQKLSDSREMHTSFSIIFFDIDYFKRVNDLFGHKIGDSVLVELAVLIQEHLAIRDRLGRWGGEEFIVISDVTGNNAIAFADYLREKVEEHEFKEVGRLTASFGVADSRLEDTIDSLLNRADEGLYQSKNTGKNKVSMIN